jgi:[ribosomal protein S18]-alanine N-acetyltransferase
MMVPEEKFTINLTADPQKTAVCAHMMSETDPWITLGMDYNQCIKAFDGDWREIYVIENENGIAGFVILQVCGTFSGYIQTICIGEKYRGHGLGTKLLRFCEERILKFSPNVFICVSSFNRNAARLYYKCGFRLVGEMDNFVKEGFSELLLRKTFGPRVGYLPHQNQQQ